MKIAIIGSRGYPYVYSGYETLVKELSERLVKKGHRVRIYCHSSLFEKKPKLVNGVELVYTPSIETKFLSQFINSFFSTLHFCFSSFDVGFYVNSANGPFGIITKIFKKKTCINVDGLEWLRPKWSGLGSKYFKISSKLSTIFFDKIITDSFEMNKIYNKRYFKDSSVIAYGSTMTNSWRNEVLERFNLKKNEFYLVVGRLIPDNNSKLILDGFIKSKTQKKIVVVGDVPYKDTFAEKIKSYKSDKIIFTGYIRSQPELTALYANCFGYIHGHEFGGTNPTMINALHLNCEILALDTLFSREMLKGKTVVFFDKTVDSILKSIKSFENNYISIQNYNIEYNIPLEYDWDYIAKKYIDVFKKTTNYQNM